MLLGGKGADVTVCNVEVGAGIKDSVQVVFVDRGKPLCWLLKSLTAFSEGIDVADARVTPHADNLQVTLVQLWKHSDRHNLSGSMTEVSQQV